MIIKKDIKNLKSEDLDKISGGYTDYGNDSTNIVHCDNCGRIGAFPIGGSGGHLCIACMKQIRDKLGEETLAKVLKKG